MKDNDHRFTEPRLIEFALNLVNADGFTVDVACHAESCFGQGGYSPEPKLDDAGNPWLFNPALRARDLPPWVPCLGSDGLAPEAHWRGHVWCNPPYSDIEPWVRRAWRTARDPKCRSVSMLIPGNRGEQPYWQELVEPYVGLEFIPMPEGDAAPSATVVRFDRFDVPKRPTFTGPTGLAWDSTAKFPVCVLRWLVRPRETWHRGRPWS